LGHEIATREAGAFGPKKEEITTGTGTGTLIVKLASPRSTAYGRLRLVPSGATSLFRRNEPVK
jgi:hypothetical protein